MRRFAAIPLAFMLLISSVFSGAAQEPDWECDGLDDYVHALAEVVPPDDDFWNENLLDDTILEMRPSQLRAQSERFDEIATGLDEIPEDDVPLVARDFHDALVTLLSIISSMFLAMVEGGPFALLAYTETAEAAAQAVDDAAFLGEERCGDLWITTTDDLESTPVATPTN